MTIDGEEIPSEEFVYLYQKNLQQQASNQSLEDYLPLFINYRLKVAEAKKQGIDTLESFRNEMKMYRRELLQPYVNDSTFFNQLLAEALERNNYAVESSHIMIIRTHNEAVDSRNLALLDSIRKELLNGADFIEMARNYSQDKFSSDKGGYLGFTQAGTFPYDFETAEYQTPEGEISDIIESHVGWHIVKAGARKSASELGFNPKTKEDVKMLLQRAVSSPFDSRYHLLRKNQIENLKNKHPEVNIDGKNDDEALDILLSAEELTQYQNNAEYRNLVDEYVNGSLLYEASVEQIWNRASNDEEGLQDFYLAHVSDYGWDTPHAKGILIQTLSDSVSDVLKSRIVNLPSDSIVPIVRKEFRGKAKAEKFNIAEGGNNIIDVLMFGKEKDDNSKISNFVDAFIVEGRIVEAPESLEDVKSRVINDYQDYLEQNWTQDLKSRHNVELNKKEWERIKKKLQVK